VVWNPFNLFGRARSAGPRPARRRAQAQEELDRLTGLYARAGMEARLEAACASAEAGNELIAVAYVNIDRLRLINEERGFLVGDQCLREVARRLTEYVGESGVLARLEADDFLILFRGLAARLAAGPLTEKIGELLSEKIHTADLDVALTAYCGIANFPLDGKTPVALVSAAAAAMTELKVQARALSGNIPPTAEVSGGEGAPL
jgi:diguanylate cyclase (GGDEF)-like protein